MSLEDRYQLGLNVIREAGDLALGYFNARETLTIQSKGVQDMASEADLNTELLIKRRAGGGLPAGRFFGRRNRSHSFCCGAGHLGG